MTWIDTLVVAGIIIFGIFIMYRALQEPIDALFSLIAKAISGISSKMSDKSVETYDEIRYG